MTKKRKVARRVKNLVAKVKQPVAKVENTVARVEEQPVAVVEKPVHLTLVLNGGSDVMDNSTIPVRWFFSKELAEKSPEYLILFDQTENEFGLSHHGRRYVVKVEESVKFIQLHRAGKHRLTVLAFNNQDDALKYLVQDSRNEYKKDIQNSLVLKYGYIDDCLAANFVDYIVPGELFAKEPTSKLGKLVFHYLLWPRKKMTDECDMRKQALLAIPKLLIFVLWYALKITGFVLYLLYMIIAPMILFFIGYCPISLSHWWERIRDLVVSGEFSDCLEVRANGDSIDYLQLYHRDPKRKGHYNYEYIRTKRMFVSPILLLLGLVTLGAIAILLPHIFESKGDVLLFFHIALGIFALILGFILIPRFVASNNKEKTGVIIFFGWFAVCYILSFIFVILNINYLVKGTTGRTIEISAIIVTAIALVVLAAFFIDKKSEKVKEVKEKKQKIERKSQEEKYKEYLLENYTTPESKVNLKKLPETFSGNNAIKKFRVDFWTLKAKICRPYQN